MANNDDLILRGKALKDLRGIKDVLVAQGDPILASILNRAISCIENQPKAAECIDTRVAELEAELAAALMCISDNKNCNTCKHQPNADSPICRAAQWDCCDCENTACVCNTCTLDCDKWEWRGTDGR
jgi:hypothetical protein